MAPRTRIRILLIAIVAALIVARELSIRRHANDLHDWPQHDESA